MGETYEEKANINGSKWVLNEKKTYTHTFTKTEQISSFCLHKDCGYILM